MGDDNLGLLRGTLDLLILKALATGDKHGYAVSEWIESATDGNLLVEEGTLYPALHRLARKGLVGATWGVSENNRRAKYYTLTVDGGKHLEEETTTWRRYSDAMERALAQGRAG
jgi:PadR family transcriptional regulator PadR